MQIMDTKGNNVPERGLIVNADDFGLSSSINHGIIQGYLKGIVTSTTLVAVGGAFDEAVNLLLSHPGLGVGLHLTLVGEKPLLGQNDIPTLIDAEGRFPDHAMQFTQRLLTRRIRLDEVGKELDAQIQLALDHGISLSHLDSHQHLHMLPGAFSLVFELAQKYQIPAIRLPKEAVTFASLFRERLPKRSLQQAVLWGLCQQNARREISSPDHFRGFAVGGNLTREALLNILSNLPKHGITELMCHPGLGEQDSPYAQWHYNHAAELAALSCPEAGRILEKMGVRLISYHDLATAGQR